jgi:hypothetical protein
MNMKVATETCITVHAFSGSRVAARGISLLQCSNPMSLLPAVGSGTENILKAHQNAVHDACWYAERVISRLASNTYGTAAEGYAQS